MDNEIEKLLDEEIKTEIKSLASMTLTSEEKSDAIDDLAKLYKLRNEHLKIMADFWEAQEKTKLEEKQLREEAESRKGDERVKEEQLKEDARNRYFRFGVEAAGIILPMIFYAFWMRKGFKFEETGTYTSTTFRGLFNRFKPTRKS